MNAHFCGDSVYFLIFMYLVVKIVTENSDFILKYNRYRKKCLKIYNNGFFLMFLWNPKSDLITQSANSNGWDCWKINCSIFIVIKWLFVSAGVSFFFKCDVLLNYFILHHCLIMNLSYVWVLFNKPHLVNHVEKANFI